jgi:CRISPR-associated protein (TIGR03986 family)
MNQSNQVHAPYHFVPLSKWVYMPDWAHLVSHDVPFKDGVSGVLEYTLTNATPLCVGGEQEKSEGKPTLVKWARDPKGDPVIPGSSLKGMLRSVLEIASFGKFAAIDDSHFSFRDISNAETRYAKEIAETEAQAYWIKFDPALHQWTFRKAKHTTLFHDEFNQFSKKYIQNIAFKQPAEDKYAAWPLSQPAINFDLETRIIMGTKNKDVSVERASKFGAGAKQGYPVFSGFRPGKKEHTARRLNFSYMFYDENEKSEKLALGNQLVQKLFENHAENLVNTLKKRPHPKLGIPVFARENKQGQIIALGFAKMPRKLYDNSVNQVASQTQKLLNSANTFDLSELMFGTLRDQGYGIKSRVSFSDGVCDKNTGIAPSNPVILGQPAGSYLSAYLEQKANDLNQVNNELSQYERNSTLKGWKRDPSQTTLNGNMTAELQDKQNVQSTIDLMTVGSEFSGRIVFHNLKPAELGALLWVIQLQAEGKPSYHSLGHGKPLGAGAVRFNNLRLTVRGNDGENDQSIEGLIAGFITHMNKCYPQNKENSWQDSAQIRHLLAFGDKDDNVDKNLRYMPLNAAKGDDTTTSYTNSVKGRTKQVLPLWQHAGQTLPRDEAITQLLPASFASGRLAELFAHCEKEQTLTVFESTLNSEIQLKQKAQVFAEMSVQAQLFFKLKERLESQTDKNGRQSCNTDLDQLIDACLAQQINDSFVSELYALCKDTSKTAYLDLAKNKQNKAKLEARKAKLADLAAKYKVNAN